MNPTIRDITEELKKAGCELARSSVYPHLDKLGIEPVGARRRPQRYPADAIPRLINHFGLGNPLESTRPALGILPFAEIKRRASKRKAK